MKSIIILILLHSCLASYAQRTHKKVLLHFNSGISIAPSVTIDESNSSNTLFSRKNKKYFSPGIGIEFLQDIKDN